MLTSSFFLYTVEKIDKVEKCIGSSDSDCDNNDGATEVTSPKVLILQKPTVAKDLDPRIAADNCELGRFTINLDRGDAFIRHFQDTKLYSRRAFDGKTFKAESLVPADGRRPDKVLNFGGADIPVVWETGLGANKTVYMRRYFGSGKAVMVREAKHGREDVACRPRK